MPGGTQAPQPSLRRQTLLVNIVNEAEADQSHFSSGNDASCRPAELEAALSCQEPAILINGPACRWRWLL